MATKSGALLTAGLLLVSIARASSNNVETSYDALVNPRRLAINPHSWANISVTAQDNAIINDEVETQAADWIFMLCNSGERQAIKDALKEAHTIIESEGTRYMDLHWNDYSMVEYLGPPFAVKPYQDRVQATFNSLRTVKKLFNGDKNTKIYCHNNNREGGKDDCNPDTNPNPIFVYPNCEPDKTTRAIVFCDGWFRLGTLDDKYSSASLGDNLYNLQFYENRAQAWITALMLTPSIPSISPRTPLANRKVTYPIPDSLMEI